MDPVKAHEHAAATIQLFSRLWQRLEALWEIRCCPSEPGRAADFGSQLQIFRLELVVLLDRCDSRRWQMLLRSEQRRIVRATVEEVLRALAVPLESNEESLIRAQNRLFDAVQGQYAAALLPGGAPGHPPPPMSPTCTGPAWQGAPI